MSDAMTNREIEDVLTSIRRLVAQEGSRPADSGRLILTEAQRINSAVAANSDPNTTPNFNPGEATATASGATMAGPDAGAASESAAAPSGAGAGTAAPDAFDAPDAQGASDTQTAADDTTGADDRTEGADRPSDGGPSADTGEIVPSSVPSPVRDPVRDPVSGRAKSTMPESALPEPDFGKLEATIAELEAAVSASGESWEPETATGDAPRVSNVTDLYGRLTFARRDAQSTGEGADDGADGGAVVQESTDSAPATAVLAQEVDAPAIAPEPGQQADDGTGAAAIPAEPANAPHLHLSDPEPLAADTIAVQEDGGTVDRVDDDDTPHVEILDDGPDTGFDSDPAPEREPETDRAESFEEDTIIDEATLRALVAQIVRDELHGQLGERVTQQVRKLVRSEIAKALDDRKYL